MACWGFNGDGQLGLGHARAVGGRAEDMGAGLATVDLHGEEGGEGGGREEEMLPAGGGGGPAGCANGLVLCKI